MIHIQDVIKIFENPITKMQVPALRGIDLEIRKGELISIVGPSGSGKTTLINIIAGLEKASSGKVTVNNINLEKLSSSELDDYRLNSVGLIEQFPERSLLLRATVEDNLAFTSSLYTNEMKLSNQYNHSLLEKLNITHLKKHRVNTLSGGEMIRVAIACMLAKKVPIILCDEPTGQLDAENTELVKNLLREIAEVLNTTVIVVTHDLRFHDGINRTCQIENGRVSSLLTLNEQQQYSSKSEFPLKFISNIDSTKNARIPDIILETHQLSDRIEFQINEDGRTSIKNPSGAPPKKFELHKQKKMRKELNLLPLPKDYHKEKKIVYHLQNVSKKYKNNGSITTALIDIDLKIVKGEKLFLIGPSGSGKTTLMKLLSGMEACTSGDIKALDKSFSDISDADRAAFRLNSIGITSQQGNLHPYLSTNENLILKNIVSGKKLDREITQLNEEVFIKFKLQNKQAMFPTELSGGELQRAALASAIIDTPPILLFDEPTANLDSELIDDIIQLLYQLSEKTKSTMVISTHDINLIPKGTRVIELINGRIFRDGIAKSKK